MTRHDACPILLALLACAPSTFAGAEDYQGLPVVSVEFEPAAQPAPPDELRALIPTAAGKPLDLAALRASIEKLYETGRYESVRADASPSGGGVVIRFVTDGAWFVGQVDVAGVPDPPNKGQLAAATKLQLGVRFHKDDLSQAVDNIRSRLEANGFHEAQIDPQLSYDNETQQVNIIFEVNPGVRAKFSAPVIDGIPPGEYNSAVLRTRWKRLWGLFGWQPATELRVQTGVDRLRQRYSRQNFLLSRVNLEQMTYKPAEHRVQPALSIVLGSKVSVITTGAKVSGGDLRKLVPVFQEQAADRDLLVEGMRNLIEHFQSQGYFRVHINFETRQEPGGNQTVVYHIDLGEKYKLALLDVTGNKYFDTATILERMSVIPASFLRYRNGRYSETLIENDAEAIRALYRTNGFRDAMVAPPRVDENYQGKPHNLSVHLNIDEGRQWVVSKLEVEGSSDEHREHVLSLFSSVEDQPFSFASLVADRDNVLNYYYNQGYPDVLFEWNVNQDPVNARTQVHVTITEGQRSYVRGLIVGGLRNTNPKMVRSRIHLNSGDPLSQAAMIESQRRLYDLGIFARVDMALQNPDGQETSRYLLYQFEEGRKYSLNLGFGAEIARIGGGNVNFDAPAGQPGFSPRVSIGLSRANLFGAGHTASVQTRFSNIQQRGLISYLVPHFRGSETTALTVGALYDLSRDVRTFQLRRQEASIQISNRLSRANTLQTRFAYRRNTISNLAIDESSIPIFARGVRVGIISASFIQDRRDDVIDSRKGYYNTIDVAYASKAFYSDTDYLRILARNSTYHTIGRELVLARSITLGWIHNLRAGGADGIPLPERFFSGGASTHRGFPDNQAGPRDPSTGFALGGSGILVHNTELRFPLFGDNLGGVLFHDAGNVYSSLRAISLRWNQGSTSDFNYMVHAMGIGVRYRTPVGPVRFDLGYGINSPRFLKRAEDGQLVGDRINQLQFHFSLGQTF